jgi:hypothetical protein
MFNKQHWFHRFLLNNNNIVQVYERIILVYVTFLVLLMKNILLGQSSATPWCLDIGLVIEATVMNNNMMPLELSRGIYLEFGLII